jgi:predicted nuclease of restriction endonuclease-like RecB superfamily
MMTNMNKNTTNENITNETRTEVPYSILNDVDAEKSILKLKDEQAERDRQIETAEEMIKLYKFKIEEANNRYEKRTEYIRFALNQYFQSVEHKVTKTQESYRLPSATLKLKIQKPEIRKDETKFLEFLKERELSDFIAISEKPKWGEFKELTEVSGTTVILKETGEIVDGITAEDRDAKFEIEIEK